MLKCRLSISRFVPLFGGGRGITPYGQISLQSGATSPTISNQVTISPTKHRLRLQYLLPYHFLFFMAEPK